MSPLMTQLCGVLASSALLALYVQGDGAWPLGFVLLVPWLLALRQAHSWRLTLASAWLMTLGYSLAGFSWFAIGIAQYLHWPTAWGLGLLLLAAPLFQPQLLAFALLRYLLARRWGAASRVAALGACAAWVGCEWLYPKLLGDTLGHGLYPSPTLRQAAALGGAAGLSLLLLLANESLAHAMSQLPQLLRERARVGGAARRIAPAVLGACACLALPAGYGNWREAEPPAGADAPRLRAGLVQANITDYETRRQSQGSYAVVREVLDTHYAMSYDAIERQKADVVLWSETIYPTRFGQPRNETGAALDQEIQSIIDAAGVPFVFGSYEADDTGEYNVAVFAEPRHGRLGAYRKTRLFPFTEMLPDWAEGLRRWLPGAGQWRAGSGARVFPLRLHDGREVPVQALICRDDTDAQLALDGARLGARALLTLSNDSWFSQAPLGARLHLAVAAFRSIETGLPQFRVTTNGYSALIDPQGRVLAEGAMNQRTLVVGSLSVGEPRATLMRRWGDWVGPAALAALAVLALALGFSQLQARRALAPVALEEPARVLLLNPVSGWGLLLLHALSRLALLGLGLAWLLDEGLRSQPLQQLRLFAALVLAPEAAAACLRAAFRAELQWQGGQLVLRRGRQQHSRPLAQLTDLQAWHPAGPFGSGKLAGGLCALLGLGEGLQLQFDATRLHLLHPQAPALQQALRQAALATGARLQTAESSWPPYAQARQTLARSLLARPAPKFLLLPLLLAVPAYALHQHIAYGSWLGELHSFGLAALLRGFALWWGAWAFGVALCAAALRLLIEAAAWLAAWRRPAQALAARLSLEQLGLLLLYLGLPAWLAFRIWVA